MRKLVVGVIVMLLSLVCTDRSIACTLDVDDSTLRPGKWVSVSNTPFVAESPGTMLWVYIDLGVDDALVPAFSNAAGGFEFVVPPVLTKPWDEKPIRSVWLSDGAVGCEMTGYTFGALDRQPRSLVNLIGAVGNNFSAIAADMGFTREEIEAAWINPAQIAGNPTLYYGAAVSQTLPEYTSIVQASGRSGPAADALAVVDAFIAATGVLEHMEQADEINQQFIGNAVPALFNKVADPYLHYASTEKNNPLYHDSILKTVTAPPETNWAEPKTAEELSLQMRKQYKASIVNDSQLNSGKLRDYAGVSLGLGSIVGAATKHPGGEAIAFGYATAAHYLFMQAFSDKLVNGLYPGKFESISVGPGPWRVFTEKAPKQSVISSIDVVTSAKGLNMAKLLAELVNNFFPYKALGDGAAKLARVAATKATNAALRKLSPTLISRIGTLSATKPKQRSALFDSALESAEVVSKQMLGQQISNSKQTGFLADFEIARFNFPSVDVLEENYYALNSDTRAYLDMSSTNDSNPVFTYTAKATGTTTIRYSPHPGMWGNNAIEGSQLIEVNGGDILISPATQTVLPGEPTELTVMYPHKSKKTLEMDLNLTLSRGFKVVDVSEPEIVNDNGTRMARWVVSVSTPVSKARYPGSVTVERFSSPGDSATARIERAQITPRPLCVEPDTMTLFAVRDENNVPFTDVSWRASPTGVIDGSGQFSAPKTSGTTSIEVLNSDGVVADSVEVEIGCQCSWSVDLDGDIDQGEVITTANVGLGGVSNFLVNFIDASTLVPAIVGQGNLKQTDTLSVTIQRGETSYQSGLPVNTNVLSGIGGHSSCRMPSNRKIEWQVHNHRWLIAHVAGDAATIEEYGRGCVEATVPFSLRFVMDLGDRSPAAATDPAGIFTDLFTAQTGCMSN